MEAIPLPHRMKGYELYSWSEENEWHFTLIYATNRTKSFEEIMSDEDITDELGYAKITVRGADSIKAVMSKLPAGENQFFGRAGVIRGLTVIRTNGRRLLILILK
ncbi:MAG: hypothetical protein GY795_11020 [Desulfobacterales bacterium]|nr:hypothetical protein [Desulfobacterales bacterium]